MLVKLELTAARRRFARYNSEELRKAGARTACSLAIADVLVASTPDRQRRPHTTLLSYRPVSSLFVHRFSTHAIHDRHRGTTHRRVYQSTACSINTIPAVKQPNPDLEATMYCRRHALTNRLETKHQFHRQDDE